MGVDIIMEQFLLSISNYKILATLMAFMSIVLETFFPILPLLAIVMTNSFVLGMWLGFLVSWIGSSIASVILYLIANKCSEIKILNKYKNSQKIEKIINWIKKQGFNTIFISYACPFIPDFLVTVASGFTSVNIKDFTLGMISGKFVMFLLISYVGEDITELLTSPIKIIVLSFAIMISWVVGQIINRKIDNSNLLNDK